MRELAFIPENLGAIHRELGVSNHVGFLESCTNKARNLTSSDVFYTDLYVHSTSLSKVKHWFEAVNPSINTYAFLVNQENDEKVKVFGEVFPSVSIVVFDETFEHSPLLKDRVKQKADQYKLIIIVNFFKEELCISFSNELRAYAKCLIVDSEDLINQNGEAFLKTVVKENDVLNKLKKITYLNSISPLFVALDDVFKVENKSIKTRKTLNSQNALISRKEEQGLNYNDLTNNLRQTLQKATQDLEKNFRLKYDDLNKPNTGKFSLISQKKSSELKEFTKEELAEKSERVSVSIDKNFQDSFLKNITEAISGEMEKDGSFLKESMDDLLAKVNYMLKERGIAEIKKQQIDIPFPLQKKIVQSYCYIGKHFTGELTKHGVTEYFIALRDYIGVMMVATGLIAPLNIIASLSDEHSFIKPLAVGIKYGTALITIALIVYGVFDLRKRIPRKRIEEHEKELSKAREFLMQEAKRMFNESSRDWTANISTWIKDIVQNINSQFEKNIKEIQSNKIDKMNVDKSKQQRLQQSIDMIQANITSAERIKESLAGKFRDIVFETQKDIKF